MPPKRSTVSMSRADQVRNLWAEFEIWHTEQLAQLDERIQKVLQEIDQNRKPTGGKKKNKGKDKEKDQEIEKKKAEARKEIEKSFGGNKVREEWQSRLHKAGLFDQDWDNMTENEQRKVEKILGVDLDEVDVTIIETAPPPPAPPAPTSAQRTSPSSMFTSSMASSSRTDILSDNYAFVDPTTFSTEAIEAEGTGTFDNWLEVRQRIKSDDEISLDASTTSSWGGGNEVPAYLAWSSELSRSSTQSSQTSLSGSPERLMSKLPGPEPIQSNLVSSAVNRLNLFGDDDTPNTKRQADAAHPDPMRAGRTSFKNLDHTMRGVHPSGSSTSSINKRSKSRSRYIGPELVDREEESVEAQQFKEFKRMVRAQKIREFHDEAAQADIDLAVVIDEAIQSRTESKEVTARLIEEHEQAMLRLRQRKEEERKEIVEKERQRRLAEFDHRKRHSKPLIHHLPTISPQDEASLAGIGIDRSVLTEKFLRELQFGPDAASSSAAVSDTPTIRSHLSRMRLPNISEWLTGASNDSGTDTPTPTIPSSGWQFEDAPVTTSTLTDAPSFKRLPSGLAKSVSVDSTTSSVQSDTAPITELYASAVEADDDAKVAPPSKTSKGQVAKTKAESNKKKGKNQPVVVQAEGASSSKMKLDQMSQEPQANSAISTTKNEPLAGTASLQSTGTLPPTTFSKSSLPPPPVPLASRPNIAATPAPMWNLSQSLNVDMIPRNVAQSTQQLSDSHLQVPSSSVAIDNRRRWVPPAAAPATTAIADEKRPQPSRTLTEPPLKIKKSLTSESTIQPPPETETSRSRRLSDPIAPSPRGFDYPNGKAAAKAPAPAPAPVKAPASAKANDPPPGILKTASKSSGSSGKAPSKSSKVKRVTIEDVKDEQEEAEETYEHLPTDSRYIMEPKPVVAQGMFSQIIQFNEEEAPQAKKTKVKTAPVVAQPTQSQQIRKQESASGSSSSSSSSAAPQKSNQIWIPPQSSMAEAKAKSADKASASSSSRMPGHFENEAPAVPPVDKHVRWTANTKVIEDEGGERFLSGLDELQRFLEQQEKAAKKLREGWQQRPDADKGLTNGSDGRVGTSVGISVGTSSSMTGKSAGSHQNGLFWNPKASTSTSTHRKPLATS
ncbi:hypothetical protein L218DRAFT_461377 [Marasmius fiardii PR-910]|nr:hypothetical protein L218DRAFT_461377 [Marasmius fiardii PR-910]